MADSAAQLHGGHMAERIRPPDCGGKSSDRPPFLYKRRPISSLSPSASAFSLSQTVVLTSPSPSPSPVRDQQMVSRGRRRSSPAQANDRDSDLTAGGGRTAAEVSSDAGRRREFRLVDEQGAAPVIISGEGNVGTSALDQRAQTSTNVHGADDREGEQWRHQSREEGDGAVTRTDLRMKHSRLHEKA